MSAITTHGPEASTGGLHRTVGFWGLSFVSLGSIIGSGWLLGALTAATIAGGGGSLISWVIAAVMLMVLALIHADLGAAYPVAGGTSRYPHYAFGGLGGFAAGWVTYLQAVAIAPLEVEASLSYVNSIDAVKSHVKLVNTNGTLTLVGILIGIVAMIGFMLINLAGAKWMSDSNTAIVLWKIFVPLLTIVTLLLVSFHPGNFTAGGGFAPYGFHGIFAALPAGVVFALQGFEQATQMAGEAKNPQKDVAKAIILAMVVGAIIYIGLEVAFVGALDPAKIVHNWQHPIGVGDYGPYYTLAINAGVGWLATILIIDAVISPGGTGLIYVGTTARISYALGLPDSLTKVNKRGVPVWSVLVATVFGILFLMPAPSWQELVGLITGATALMYAFAPISLGALRRSDPDREHPYRVPWPAVTLPVGFAFANLIIYWGTFTSTWKLAIGVVIGGAIYLLAALVNAKNVDPDRARWRFLIWLVIWQVGLILLGWAGNYGGKGYLPDDWDALVVAAFAVAMYYFAVLRMAYPREEVEPVVDADLSHPTELRTSSGIA
ncbi:amino acid/polyamine/organocation transporter (APC superfamily) [Branchiibius hedensis]|uniref:Amino acid transporter n=1 Tax=Branchiibius hedensis TaxID=672460 RepID=A0A2Y8ZUD4_9MICO|nr:APC family permease [Branchiibius hedensis]PWJ26076.1 amino acid/polyamine/organocation transporter (APC superfamily) [Branchiibius hedensis]SSA34888.1 Amino acid transporter [Branchiibius hedensis]